MANKVIRPLADDNVRILDAIRAEASLDYQARVPRATQAGIQATVEALTSWRPRWNEFEQALINRIGSVVCRNISWSNPLAEFKRGMLTFGDTIEEIQVGLLKAHTYDAQREYLEKDLFGTEKVPVQTNFHTVNRQEFYKVTVNELMLRRAFLEDGGLSTFIAQTLAAPASSDEWDEFLLMLSLIDEYEAAGGFWHVNVPDVRNFTADSDDARLTLRKIRAMAETIQFPSTRYNAAHMPVSAQNDDLFLLTTPEFKATMDVEALAGAFNVDRADIRQRIVTVPDEHFAKNGAQALLTTRDFFVVADVVLENTSQPNAAGLTNNYFLHHHEIMSASRFVPAVMFWTGADDEVIEIQTPVTGITAVTVHETSEDGPTVTEVERGGKYVVFAEGVTTPEGGTNVAVKYTVDGISPRTQVSQSGVLNVAGDESQDTLTVTATTTWLDDTNVRLAGKTATVSVDVTGPVVPDWPAQRQDGPPVVSTILPTGQGPGDEVTLTGTGLADVSSVTIGGVAAQFDVVSGTQIDAVIPSGTTAGAKPVVVTDPQGSSTPVNYTVVV